MNSFDQILFGAINGRVNAPLLKMSFCCPISNVSGRRTPPFAGRSMLQLKRDIIRQLRSGLGTRPEGGKA